MSTETTRRCDNCSAIVNPNDELWTIGVIAVLNANPRTPFPAIFNQGQVTTRNNKLLENHWKDYCRPCMTEKGLVVAPNEEPAKKPDTLDDLLREIVREEVDDAYGEQ